MLRSARVDAAKGEDLRRRFARVYLRFLHVTQRLEQDTADFDALCRTESRLSRGPSVSLFRSAWQPERPRRILLVVHGFGEHCLRYDDFGHWFAGRDCVVHAYDQRGHGRSSGPRGHLDRIDDLLDDLTAILEAVRLEHPGLPVTVIGHSFGGLVAATHARERHPEIAGLVLSGPLLRLSRDLSPMLKVLSRTLGFLLPRLAVDAGINADGLSTDSQVGVDYLADEHVHSRMSFGFSSQMLSAMQRSCAGGNDVRLPVLLLHGGDDPLCSPLGSQVFFESLKQGGVRDAHAEARARSRLKIYPGLRHEIFNEFDKEVVFADLLDWIEEIEVPLSRSERP